MQCEAKIHDEFGNKYKCIADATKKITIKTFAPHLDRVVTKVRHMCNDHGKKLLNRHRYQIKHKGKETELSVYLLNN